MKVFETKKAEKLQKPSGQMIYHPDFLNERLDELGDNIEKNYIEWLKMQPIRATNTPLLFKALDDLICPAEHAKSEPNWIVFVPVFDIDDYGEEEVLEK